MLYAQLAAQFHRSPSCRRGQLSRHGRKDKAFDDKRPWGQEQAHCRRNSLSVGRLTVPMSRVAWEGKPPPCWLKIARLAVPGRFKRPTVGRLNWPQIFSGPGSSRSGWLAGFNPGSGDPKNRGLYMVLGIIFRTFFAGILGSERGSLSGKVHFPGKRKFPAQRRQGPKEELRVPELGPALDCGGELGPGLNNAVPGPSLEREFRKD